MHKTEVLNNEQRRQVIDLTCAYIRRAGELYELKLAEIPVTFDLSGRVAGSYRVAGGQRRIRYNPWLFARYFAQNLASTVPHEVAHYVTDSLFAGRIRAAGPARIRPHGREWQAVMQKFGAQAERTCSYDMTGIPARRYTYYDYGCDCRQHRLGSRRHMKVLREQASYACRVCGGVLRCLQG